MLASFVPLESEAYVIDKYLRKGFKGINELLVTMLLYLKDELLATEPEDLLEKMTNSWLAKRAKEMNWQELTSCSDNMVVREFVF